MKFLVTAVAQSTVTRRRRGKSWTAVVNSHEDSYNVERRYERMWNIEHPHESCKVIDVRELPDTPPAHDPAEEVTIISAEGVSKGILRGNDIIVVKEGE